MLKKYRINNLNKYKYFLTMFLYNYFYNIETCNTKTNPDLRCDHSVSFPENPTAHPFEPSRNKQGFKQP